MKTRIISAVVAMIIFIPMIILGGIPFTILTYAMATIALYEIYKMRNFSLFTGHGMISILLLWIILLPTKYVDLLSFSRLGKYEFVAIAALIYLAYTVIVKNKINFDDIGFSFISVMYIGIGFHFIVETRMVGLIYILYALTIVWVTDSGAYFVGRAMGKNKLWPEISPNKTIEGFIGGVISALIAAVLYKFITHMSIPLGTLLILTTVLSIFGQLGDLVESAIKRHYNVKDSGNIMPGHGGILDRCDSWLFVLPLLHLLYLMHL